MSEQAHNVTDTNQSKTSKNRGAGIHDVSSTKALNKFIAARQSPSSADAGQWSIDGMLGASPLVKRQVIQRYSKPFQPKKSFGIDDGP